MRNSKFRAWSKSRNKFLTVGFSIIGEVTVFDMLNDHCLRIKDLDDLVISQWTGLQDSSGRDIYEGDILWSNLVGEEGQTVIFKDGQFTTDGLTIGCNNLFDEINQFAGHYVCGNIFEAFDDPR